MSTEDVRIVEDDHEAARSQSCSAELVFCCPCCSSSHVHWNSLAAFPGAVHGASLAAFLSFLARSGRRLLSFGKRRLATRRTFLCVFQRTFVGTCWGSGQQVGQIALLNRR